MNKFILERGFDSSKKEVGRGEIFAELSEKTIAEFEKINKEQIKAENESKGEATALGILSHNLVAETAKVISLADNMRGHDFAVKLAQYIKDDLSFTRRILKDEEEDRKMKDEAISFLDEYVSAIGEEAAA